MSRRRRKNPKADLFGAIFVFLLYLSFTKPELITSILENALIIIFLALILGAILYFSYKIISKRLKKQVNVPNKNVNTLWRKPNKQSLITTSEKVIDKTQTKNTLNTENKWSKDLINSLEWRRFEYLCYEYFKSKGYQAELTGKGADGGIDVKLFKKNFSETKPFGLIQCKAWGKSRVGVKLVRELYGIMASEKAPLGVFMTTGEFTSEAIEFSKNKKLKLISGNALLKLILELPYEIQQSFLEKITRGDYLTPTCPSCDIKMILRTSKKGINAGGQFWGCKNFPRCRSTLQLKT